MFPYRLHGQVWHILSHCRGNLHHTSKDTSLIFLEYASAISWSIPRHRAASFNAPDAFIYENVRHWYTYLYFSFKYSITSPRRTWEQSLSILRTLCFQIFIGGVDYLIILLKTRALHFHWGNIQCTSLL